MSNPLPTNDGKIYNLATRNYNGIVSTGASVPVTLLTAAEMLASKTAFKTAATTFNAARNGVRDAYKVFTPAMKSLTAWLYVVRTVLAGRLGRHWSAAWAEAGFVNNTTSVPDTIEGRIALGLALVTFFTNHPEYEVENMDVTAAKATALTDAATAAQTTVAAKEQAQKDADDARQPARASTLGLIGSLIANLNDKLAPDDPRWLAFGLQMPATPTTPGQPQNVSLSLATDGSILVQCDATALATRYRCRMFIVGIDTKYRLVWSGVDPLGTITGVEPGVTVQIIMQAVNGNSQSVASEPVVFTMPVASAPQKAAEIGDRATDEVAALSAIAPNGNGNGSHALKRSR